MFRSLRPSLQRVALRRTRSSVLLGLGLSLACSSAGREAEPDAAVESEAQTPVAKADDEPGGPIIGAPAPALALDSLSGERVQLPIKDSTHATVLIFGSFS